jgi:hypothetical protein
LLHSKPETAPDGRRRLLREGDAWSQAEIAAIAAAFEECTKTLESEG